MTLTSDTDLHMHSLYSDGQLSPTELAKLAHSYGLKTVALTDHDTVEGVAQMRTACTALEMTNVNGVEVTTYYKRTIDILGYGIDIENKTLNDLLSKNRASRKARLENICIALKKYGFDIDFESQVKPLVKCTYSMSHIARALFKDANSTEMNEFFHKYLLESGLAYQPSVLDTTPIDAINAIHAAGGKAVIAHPMRYKYDDKAITELITYLKDNGLDGIEAYYRKATKEVCWFYASLAKKLNLETTYGGDFHSIDRGNKFYGRD